MSLALAIENLLAQQLAPELIGLLTDGLRLPRVADERDSERGRQIAQQARIEELIEQRDWAVRLREELIEQRDWAARLREELIEQRDWAVRLRDELAIVHRQRDLEAEALARVEGVSARLRERLSEAEAELVSVKRRLADQVAGQRP